MWVGYRVGDIYRIRYILPIVVTTVLANTLVSSKLDYCDFTTPAFHTENHSLNVREIKHILSLTSFNRI